MALKEALHRLIEKELEVEGAAVGKSENETGEATAGASDRDEAEGGPIDLRLFVMVCAP
jgi:hypothetical protein